jgi:predicted RNase H-like nuclease (RuvC/YqgF family)
MVKKLSELEKLKLENSNLQLQITEYQQIVAELSAQLKEHKDTADFNRSFETDKK